MANISIGYIPKSDFVIGSGGGKGICFDFCDEVGDNECAISAENERLISLLDAMIRASFDSKGFYPMNLTE
jgi:hypothetical protein